MQAPDEDRAQRCQPAAHSAVLDDQPARPTRNHARSKAGHSGRNGNARVVAYSRGWAKHGGGGSLVSRLKLAEAGMRPAEHASRLSPQGSLGCQVPTCGEHNHVGAGLTALVCKVVHHAQRSHCKVARTQPLPASGGRVAGAASGRRAAMERRRQREAAAAALAHLRVRHALRVHDSKCHLACRAAGRGAAR